jgi:hypothetical protein
MEAMATAPQTATQPGAPGNEVGAGLRSTPPSRNADDGAVRLLILRPPVPLDVFRQALRQLAAKHSMCWRS